MGLAGQGSRATERGYAMAALLVGMSVMAVMMAAALPVWTHFAQREKEEELIWRGEQYRRAIMLFQRRYANTFPPTVDILVEQKFLRKKYKDPITNDDFQIIPVGGAVPGGRPGMPGTGGGPANAPGAQGGAGGFGAAQPGAPTGAATSSSFGQATQPAMGIQGVTSKSKEQSIKLYNGMDRYNQWAFVYLAASTQAGAGGAGFARPGMGGPPGGGGQPFGQPGGGFGQPGGGFGQPGGGFGQPGGGFGQPGGGFGQPGGGFGQPGGGFGQPGGGFGQPGAPAQPKYPPVPGGFGSPGGFGTPGGGVPPAGPGGSVFTPVNPGSGGQSRPPGGGFGSRPPGR
ncbi:MAG: type II secretion system protein [Acidobacteria bacterium]|nr:type II secretion system protein [Acidobacteriota bacterium]